MRSQLCIALTLTSILTSAVCAQTEDLGTFASPAAIARPRFRYWLPDAGVSADVVAKDIRQAGQVGAGGVEFLAFYNYGGMTGPAPLGSDWSRDNFGTPAFQSLLVAALEAHHDGGLRMDVALGPNQGQGVPARPDDEGLQWDLFPYAASVSSGESFNGTLPGWGNGTLITAISAKLVSKTVILLPPSSSTFTVAERNYTLLVVENGTLQDHTGQVVQSSGFLAAEFASEGPHMLFAFYQRLSAHHNLIAAREEPQTIFDDGSYIVDHFDAMGAQTVIDFWERYILNDEVRELLRDAGQCAWEDSMELESNISWSKTLPSRFQNLHGYDIRTYLPLIIFGNNNINIQSGDPGAYRVLLNTADQGFGYINDYRLALQHGYQEYLSTLRNWTREHLNISLSTQVSYNMPMDMEASIPFVDVPEIESLQFRDNVDGYRQFSTPAYLAGKDVVSIELGAVFGYAYAYTLPELLFAADRAFVGGINRLVIHGQTFSGNYSATTWPGYTTFVYYVSEMYSEKQPSWDHGLRAAIDYAARVGWVQQQGVAKLDLAMFNLQSVTDPAGGTIYGEDDLADAGWTYGYISPANFDLAHAFVRDGVLAPDGPGFKALIVSSEQNITLASARALQDYADAGLPVIILGGDPRFYASGDGRDQEAVLDAIAKLRAASGVYSVPVGQLVATLAGLGLTPSVGLQADGRWWTTWREDKVTGTDYTFVLGDVNATAGELEVQTTKIPYVLNPWTGECKALLHYSVVGNVTKIPLSLAGNETVIIAFSENPFPGVDLPQEHITNAPAGVLGSAYSCDDGLVAHIPSSAAGPVQLSSGHNVSADGASAPSALPLTNWMLTAEHWEAPADIYDAATIAAKRNTTHQLSSLVSWRAIPALANVSGIGYYSTTFSWPPAETANADLGAYITFSSAVHAITLYINGERTTPLSYVNPVLEISPYLKVGENEVLAVVPTVMRNYLLSIKEQLRNGGRNVTMLAGNVDTGLIGDVEIVPFARVRLDG